METMKALVFKEVGKLVVNPIEAERVRTIFNMYLRLDGVLPVVDKLRRFGWTTKTWITRKGKIHEGHPYNKASVYTLLKNPLCVGKVKYRKHRHQFCARRRERITGRRL